MNVLGIDVGGSGIKGAPVDTIKGEFTKERYRIPTPIPATPEAVSQTIKQIAEHFCWQGKIGVGFPAVIQNGVAKTASNIDKSWINCDAQKTIANATGLNSFILNDADAAGVAEMRFGAGKDHKGIVLLLTIGTGIGSVVFNNEKLMPNTEFGHIMMNGSIAEKYASDATRKREELSWSDWGQRFNEYLKIMERLIYPDIIIIGGGASKKFSKFKEQISINTPIVPAKLSNHAGIIGAAIYASEEIENR